MRGFTLVTVLLLLLVRVGPVFAHAAPLVMEPRGGSILAASPAAVRLEFSQPVELKFSRVEVRSGGELAHAEALRLESGRILVLPLPPLGASRYDVKWRVLSTDGHVTEGSYWFEVAAGGAGEVAADGLSAAAPGGSASPDWGLYTLVLLVAAPLAFVLLTMRGAVRW